MYTNPNECCLKPKSNLMSQWNTSFIYREADEDSQYTNQVLKNPPEKENS